MSRNDDSALSPESVQLLSKRDHTVPARAPCGQKASGPTAARHSVSLIEQLIWSGIWLALCIWAGYLFRPDGGGRALIAEAVTFWRSSLN